MRRRAREAESARARLAQRLGRTPAEEEVARELGVGIAEHRAFLAGLWRAQVGSFEARLECGDGPGRDLHQLVADGRATDPESAVEAAEVRARIVQAIRTLGEKERVVTTFYYYDGLTLKEIGGAHEPHRGANLADTSQGSGEVAGGSRGEPRANQRTLGRSRRLLEALLPLC